MIFPIFSFSGLLALLAFSAQATPLSRRDVVAPKIITPNAQTVWPIGTTQTVTWDTADLPPPSQITNLMAQIILGFNSSDSLNLDFNNPLAQGFKITDGSVQITVPNVTPRTNYLIVLFGDSGDTSPSFAITQISTGSSSSSQASSPTTSSGGDKAAATSSTLITTPIPITGSVITGGSGTSTDSVPASATVSGSSSSATATSPASSSASGSTSGSASAASSSASSASSTSAAWSVHRTDYSVMSFKTLSMGMVSAIMLIMTY